MPCVGRGFALRSCQIPKCENYKTDLLYLNINAGKFSVKYLLIEIVQCYKEITICFKTSTHFKFILYHALIFLSFCCIMYFSVFPRLFYKEKHTSHSHSVAH